MSSLDDYDFDLPRELIAQHPVARRSDARLLIVDRRSGNLNHAHVRDLPQVLASHDCLVMNNTKVLPARLVGRREQTGGRWTGLFLASNSRDAWASNSGDAWASNSRDAWHLMGKTRGKLQAHERIVIEARGSQDELRLELIQKLDDGSWFARPESDRSPLELLEQFGRVPLPPYIRDGAMVDADRDQYQTVYASQPGAVAAPTAGLHFTEGLLDNLREKGLASCFITLHVGAGTFRPISSSLDEHEMHAEWGSIDAATVANIEERRRRGGRCLAVGTTCVRVLETAAAGGTLQPWQGETRLFIRPSHEFRAVDALLTNFHLPRTTLLVLVRTFGGDDLIRRAYREAVEQRYRFFSYGDAMLIL